MGLGSFPIPFFIKEITMQIYFVKATYTNNFYKLSDFYLDGEYKLTATKMMDINFKPDDGLTSFITRNIELLDGSSIREHTHVIIPEFEKIYRISSIDYMNIDQYMIVLDEDPMIANFLDLKGTDIILHRSNDNDLFRGVNDIADLALKESVETKVITSTAKTGKWALLFFQYNSDDDVVGLKFQKSYLDFEAFDDLAGLLAKYPEVITTQPENYSYFQKKVAVGITNKYQCVYDGSGTNKRLLWVDYVDIDYKTYYVKTYPSKVIECEVMTSILALPLETDLKSSGVDSDEILSFDRFLGPTTTNLIDIKIVNDLILEIDSVTYSLSTRTMVKTLSLAFGYWAWKYAYQEVGLTTASDKVVLTVTRFKNDFDISYSSSLTESPTAHEPFYKYDLYIYGKKFTIPYYLADDIHLLMSMNSGVVNYFIYYNDPRNILGSGSFTHSIRYKIDQLDSFYSQNPTYKDQFFTKMATDSIKTVVGGAVAGSVVPGLGTLAGAGLGLIGATVDAGLSMINLAYQEKGLRLKPDQSFGESSEVSLQMINIFGIYWVKRTPENVDLMLTEYALRGFPTSVITSIDDLEYTLTDFGDSKIVYGELKTVIKSEYVTSYINQKLKEGIVIFA